MLEAGGRDYINTPTFDEYGRALKTPLIAQAGWCNIDNVQLLIDSGAYEPKQSRFVRYASALSAAAKGRPDDCHWSCA